jgi:hypothetical protein
LCRGRAHQAHTHTHTHTHTHQCAAGFELLPENGGCSDIDECQTASKDECAKSQYCANTPGSYACRSCNLVCDLDAGCTGPSASECKACAAGYRLSALEGQEKPACEDIDECAEGKECSKDMYCFNAQGWAECKPCDEACDAEGCSGYGPGKCKGACKSGFVKNDLGSCADVDECGATPSPCPENQSCSNTRGAYACACDAPNQLVSHPEKHAHARTHTHTHTHTHNSASSPKVDGACVKPKDEL